MSLKLLIAPDGISVDELIKIYTLFCEAYKIEVDERDEQFLRTRGIKDLHKGHLDYRPSVGAKFFGQRIGNTIQFHGYSYPDDPEWKAKDEQFIKLFIQYYGKKPQ